MTLALYIIYGLSVLAIAYSYAIYPLLLRLLAKGRKGNQTVFELTDELPKVSIMMAVFNEEKVIEEKIRSVFNTSYPAGKIEFLIGSDNSTDDTHAIIHRLQEEFPNIQLTVFSSRNGKPNILNKLEPTATGEVYLFTDANVFFLPETIFEMVKHFKNPKIGQVGALFVNKGMVKSGISTQEKGYIQRESQIKYDEGVLMGTMMGAFGGCHAVRKACFVANPPNFIVEDFYISMHLMVKGYQAILEPKARVIEDLPHRVKDEFRRKTRISAGNFQNFFAFRRIWLRPFSKLAFTYCSHKVLRWFGPLWILLSWIAAGILALQGNLVFQILFCIQTFGIVVIPLLDVLLNRGNVNVSLIRYAAYFIAMNLALLLGFFKYLRGIKTNVWKPTVRTTQ